jgi:hypothetical protein
LFWPSFIRCFYGSSEISISIRTSDYNFLELVGGLQQPQNIQLLHLKIFTQALSEVFLSLLAGCPLEWDHLKASSLSTIPP